MKKAFKILLVLLLISAALAVTAPFLLHLDQVKSKAVDRLAITLDCQIKTGPVNWDLLPFPHLSIENTDIANNWLHIILPEARIYPGWTFFFGPGARLGRISLFKPRVCITTIPQGSYDWSKLCLPGTRILIQDGELRIEQAGLPQVQADTLVFSSINSEIRTRADAIEFSVNSAASFCKNISLQGRFSIPGQTYRVNTGFQGLELYKAVKSMASGRLMPVEPAVDVASDIEGRGLAAIKARIRGKVPSFIVKKEDKTILLGLGDADLSVEKSGPDISLQINNLEISDPDLTLSGNIKKYTPSAGSENGFRDKTPRWLVDLAARQVNASALRDDVLKLWGGNKIAAKVCDIVKGGLANSAHYYFEGSVPDFKDIKAMTLDVDVKTSSIHVPHAGIDLTDAGGAIQIKNGFLTGHELSARYGESSGENCSLLVALGENEHDFRLDLDIDADLKALPPVLDRLIDQPGFRDELHRFTNVNGRAKGHLSIGENINNLAVQVQISEMKGETSYDRLSWPVSIQGGQLSVYPDRVNWKDVKAEIGPQQISGASGEVSLWPDNFLTIDLDRSVADSKTLYDELTRCGAIPHNISKALSAIEGPIEITKASLEGPARVPEKWSYQIDCTARDLKITSPILPQPAVAETISASISQEEIIISGLQARFLEQPMRIRADLNHCLFDNWQGWLELNGAMQKDIAGWIRQKGWIPAHCFPRVPCTLHDLVIEWHLGASEISGEIISGTGGAAAPRVRLNVRSSPDRLQIKEFNFITQNKSGLMTLDFQKSPVDNFIFTWDGCLNSGTISALFEENPVLSGELSGSLTIQAQTGKDQVEFAGMLEADGLRRSWGTSSGILSIDNMRLLGKGAQLGIEKLRLGSGSESVDVDGAFSVAGHELGVDLNLKSDALSKETLTSFISNMKAEKERFSGGDGKPGDNQQGEPPWDITGRIGFDLQGFAVPRPKNGATETAETKKLVWNPFQGWINLYPQKKFEAHVASSQLCGINMTGVYRSDPESRYEITASSGPEAANQFEQILPCLGIDQSLIEGDFTIDAALVRDGEKWTGGTAQVHSTQGRILRMKLLSKVFSVMNITDLFSSNDIPDLDGKGFPYSSMDVETHVENNKLAVDKAVIRGEGLNLFARGEIDLSSLQCDLTVLIAPMKTIDAIVSSIPIVGRLIGGQNSTLVTIPVGVKGPISDPETTVLEPGAISESFLLLAKDIFKMPLNIINPILPGHEKGQ